MCIRECALKNESFAALKAVYDHREAVAAEWKQQGKKVVGMMGYDVPQELLVAGDMLAVQIYPTPGSSLDDANRYLEVSFRTTSKFCFQKLVDGTYQNIIDYLAISNSSDQYVRLYLYLRELRRAEPEKPIPELDFIDWLFSRNLMYQMRNERVMKIFWETAEHWAGRKITHEDYLRGVKVCNENRGGLRDFCALRCGEIVRVTGCEALIVIGASLFMEKQKHTKLVRELIKEAVSWPAVAGKRVFVSGSDQENTDIYEMIESTGAVVVGEDHNWGERICQRDVNESYAPIRALVDGYTLRSPSIQKSNVTQRVQALSEAVTSTSAQSVILLSQKYEDAISWDYPEQKKVLDAKGIPSVKFIDLMYPMGENHGLQGQINVFLETT